MISTPKMALENVTGGLLEYKGLEPGTFQHSDQLTTERRTDHGLRNQWFYTADGELYTVQKEGHLWAITREPQNLVLQNIDEAYRQLTGQGNYGNYFPDPEAARASLEHEDSVVVDMKGLKLVKDNDQYGHFVVDPKKTKKLNSEQRRVAQRIYGPDEENFGLNMEMFAEAKRTPYVFVLMPDYVQYTLRSNDKEFLGRASGYFYNDSNFDAVGRGVNNRNALRGVRRVITEASRREVTNEAPRSDLSDAPENQVPQAPQETERLRSPTMEEILQFSRKYVPPNVWKEYEAGIRQLTPK